MSVKHNSVTNPLIFSAFAIRDARLPDPSLASSGLDTRSLVEPFGSLTPRNAQGVERRDAMAIYRMLMAGFAAGSVLGLAAAVIRWGLA